MEEYSVRSLGTKQEVKGERLTSDRLRQEIEYHTKAKTHLWSSIAQYIHNEDNVKSAHTPGGDSLIMDRDNLIGVHIGCYICEEPYSPQVMNRACKGQPKGELRYV
jgi:hypothetical protein